MSKRKKRKIGLPPESLVYTGSKESIDTKVTIVQYNAQFYNAINYTENHIVVPKNDLITWYDVKGLSNVTIVEKLGEQLGIRKLLLEDVLDINQRPKVEEEDGLMAVFQNLLFFENNLEYKSEQISIYLGQNFVISFQEDIDDTFHTISERLQAKNTKLLSKNADFLFYSLIDMIVDNYYSVVDKIDELCEKLEEDILNNVDLVDRNRIYKLKRKVQEMRKLMFPTKEAVSKLINTNNPLINSDTKHFLEDIKDHLHQITESLENNRETLYNIHDLYHIQMNNNYNHVVKVLTIISTIFIPLTFIVGVYGTNFKHNFPEVDWEHGYMFMWILMIIVASISLIYFKVKKWL
jgi:magnesium transporter